MNRRPLLIFMLLMIAAPVWAYDFEVPQAAGYSLYFTIVNREENKVEVTYPATTQEGYWYGHVRPTGPLTVPALVEHDGIGYVVVSIGERAFSGCDGITTLYLPHTLVSIGDYAFSQCYGIQGLVTIGERVTYVGRSAFYACSGITAVQFNAVQCETMGGTISSTAFGGCRSLTRLLFGPKVKRIPDYAFYGMDQLDTEWSLPEELEYIGENAFAYCSKMRGSLSIPTGVQVISPYAFAQCHSLNQVTLPERLTRIDQRAFYQCVNLRQVTVQALVPPTMAEDVFAGSNAVLEIPCISERRYKSALGWNSFVTIRTLQPCMVNIAASVNDAACGTVMGGGTYPVGAKVNLVAVCNAGYSFLGWSDGNKQNPRQVTADDTVTYHAIMQPNEVEYIHDTTYVDGVQVKYEYYEMNDVAEPIASQQEITYNKAKQRVEIDLPKRSVMGVDLYNAAGQCISSGVPRHGHIDMRRYPSGNYMIRVTTLTQRYLLRFFHAKNK